MAAYERSISDLFQDIVRNIQEIIRSEVRLAKTEIRTEAGKAKSAGLWMGAGAATSVFAVGFLLLAIVYALSLVVPNWAAALIVGVLLAVGAGIAIGGSLKRFKRIQPTPERTIESLKENVEWVQQQTK